MADGKLVSLPTHQPPDTSVIARLEEMLELAKSGELRAFILAGVVNRPREPGCTVVARAGSGGIAAAIVALERARLRLLGFVEDIDIDADLSGF